MPGSCTLFLRIYSDPASLVGGKMKPKKQSYPRNRSPSFSFLQRLTWKAHLLSSWNLSTPHCNWVGVSCQRVDSLALPTRSLKGPLSPYIFSLTVLDLSSNLLHGEIPSQISSLKRLRQLLLGDNQLFGEIPSQLSELTQLQTLKLGPNLLSGGIINIFWIALSLTFCLSPLVLRNLLKLADCFQTRFSSPLWILTCPAYY